MELNDYQKKAMATKMDTCDNFGYMFLNLTGELGEFASKVAKAIRKGENFIDGNRLIDTHKTRGYFADELKKEAGDVLWQLAGLCDVMGWTLEEVATQNLDKLADRQIRGVIDGNGDNR